MHQFFELIEVLQGGRLQHLQLELLRGVLLRQLAGIELVGRVCLLLPAERLELAALAHLVHVIQLLSNDAGLLQLVRRVVEGRILHSDRVGAVFLLELIEVVGDRDDHVILVIVDHEDSDDHEHELGETSQITEKLVELHEATLDDLRVGASVEEEDGERDSIILIENDLVFVVHVLTVAEELLRELLIHENA